MPLFQRYFLGTGGEVLVGHVLLGLFLEARHHAGAAALGCAGDGVAQLEVAVAGGGVRGRDAESDQRIGVLLDEVKAVPHDGLEPVDRLDEVVGGEDRNRGVGIPLGEHGRDVADGVERVAPLRLGEVVVGRCVRQGRADRVSV